MKSFANSHQDYDAKRTVESLARMLGWGNIPPRQTLERSLNALNHRLQDFVAKTELLKDLMRKWQAEAKDLHGDGGELSRARAITLGVCLKELSEVLDLHETL